MTHSLQTAPPQEKPASLGLARYLSPSLAGAIESLATGEAVGTGVSQVATESADLHILLAGALKDHALILLSELSPSDESDHFLAAADRVKNVLGRHSALVETAEGLAGDASVRTMRSAFAKKAGELAAESQITGKSAGKGGTPSILMQFNVSGGKGERVGPKPTFRDPCTGVEVDVAGQESEPGDDEVLMVVDV